MSSNARKLRKQIRKALRNPDGIANRFEEPYVSGAQMSREQLSGGHFSGAPLPSSNRLFLKPSVLNVFSHQPPNNEEFGMESRTQSFSNQQLPMNNSEHSQNPGPGNEIDIQPHGQFPKLVIFYRPYVKRGGNVLMESFAESPYGRLDKIVDVNGPLFKVTLAYNGQTLAEGQSATRGEAEGMAVARVLKSLRKTNYFIEAKTSYFPGYKVPDCARNVDPAQSHIYKVVCLKKPNGPNFPHSLAGAVDYLSSENELWKYIEQHSRNEYKADLFVLNIEKSQRKIVKEICSNTGMTFRPLNGCSDRGAFVSHKQNVYSILEDLKRCGGDNLKYHLYPPGSDFADIHINDGDGGEEDDLDGDDHERSHKVQEDIPYDPWIAENLVLMDIYDRKNILVNPKEMLFCNVRDCPELSEFFVEKKQDKVTGMITAEALIDRKVVGRAKSFNRYEARMNASINAIQNLMEHCYYLKSKSSYFGTTGLAPQYLQDKGPGFQSKVCKIADPNEITTRKQMQTLIRMHTMKREHCDVFLLDDFSADMRSMAVEIADDLCLSVRIFRNCVCVYNKIRPKDLLKELLATRTYENEKYVVIPPSRDSKPTSGINQQNHGNKMENIPKLFDFGNKSIAMLFRKKHQESTHNMLQPNERSQNNNLTGSIMDRQQSTSMSSIDDRGMGQSSYSGGNKRSYEPDMGAEPSDKRFKLSTRSRPSSNEQTDKLQIVGNREETKPDVSRLFDMEGEFSKNSENNRMDQEVSSLFDFGNNQNIGSHPESHQQIKHDFNTDNKGLIRSDGPIDQYRRESNYEEQRNISNLYDTDKKPYVDRHERPSFDERRDEFNLQQSKREQQGNISELFYLDRNSRELDQRTEEAVNRTRNQYYSHEQESFTNKTSTSNKFDLFTGKGSIQQCEGEFQPIVVSYDHKSLDQRESGTSNLYGKSSNVGDSSMQLKEPWNTDIRSGVQGIVDWGEREADTSTMMERSRDFRDNNPQMEEQRIRDRRSGEQLIFDWGKREEESSTMLDRSRDFGDNNPQIEEQWNRDRRSGEQGIVDWREREAESSTVLNRSRDFGDNNPQIEEQWNRDRRSSFSGAQDSRNEREPSFYERSRDWTTSSDYPRASDSRAESSLIRGQFYESDRLNDREFDFSRSRDRSRDYDANETSRHRENDRDRRYDGRSRDLEPSAQGLVDTHSEFSQSSPRESQHNQEREQLWTKENKLPYKYDSARREDRNLPYHVMDLHSKIQGHLSRSTTDRGSLERRRR